MMIGQSVDAEGKIWIMAYLMYGAGHRAEHIDKCPALRYKSCIGLQSASRAA